jgi:peptidoglycan/LPS O-acetylase OafA/YrhL
MRLKNIDILRGIAAISVVYFHISGSTGLSKSAASSGHYGFLGVEIFFVISGFILPYSMYKRGYMISDFIKFLGKRILRIDPPYLTILLIAIVLMLLTKRPVPESTSIISHLGYLNGILGYHWISPVFWTLALEFQFYIFLGLFFAVFVTKSNIWSLLSISLVLLSSFFIPRSFLLHWFGTFALGIILFRKIGFKMPGLLFWCSILITITFIIFINGIAEALASLFAVIFILFVKVEKETFFNKNRALVRIYQLFIIFNTLGFRPNRSSYFSAFANDRHFRTFQASFWNVGSNTNSLDIL